MKNIISTVSENWQKRGSDLFIINAKDDTNYTYNDILLLAQKSALHLQTQGVKKGDNVVVCMNNGIDAVIIYFGCMFMGAVVAPANPVLGAENLKYVIQNSGAKLVFVDNNDWGYTPTNNYLELISAQNGSLLAFDGVNDSDELIVVYTSGTTSQPKGVIHTYASLLGNAMMFTNYMGIGKDNRFINYLPMSYLGGYYNLLMLPFVAGSSVVLCEAFSA